ncbi:hypothetical protein Cch01nite_13710 [Cellulomonas chitinilytica]|uniref:Uncharacterized protein n=1 Tax=Cellulomonas chitinilytica TaxID=398759 RepID=A0A919U1M4_9CELL|nr:hypothetical protein Cch01nite_13710 [Cellulomonas chitinilytica]
MITILTPEPLPRRRPGRRRDGAATITLHRAPVCPESGKRRYRDHHQATDALTSTRRQRTDDLARVGATRRRESRLYRCGSCLGFHLTSPVERVPPAVEPPPGPDAVAVARVAAIRAIARASRFAPTEEVAA